MAGAEALIVLSLLGCDDAGLQCDFVRVDSHRYETVEACRAASEPLLARTGEGDYPTFVAVCSPESAVPLAQQAVEPATEGAPQAAAAAVETITPPPAALPAPEPAPLARQDLPVPPEEPGLLGRVANALSALTPDRETLTKPVDVAADGASKIGGAVIVGVRRVADAVNPF